MGLRGSESQQARKRRTVRGFIIVQVRLYHSQMTLALVWCWAFLFVIKIFFWRHYYERIILLQPNCSVDRTGRCIVSLVTALNAIGRPLPKQNKPVPGAGQSLGRFILVWSHLTTLIFRINWIYGLDVRRCVY